MAKLKKEEFGYYTKTGKTSFDLNIFVSQDGKFYFNMSEVPEVIQSFAGKTIEEVRGRRSREKADGKRDEQKIFDSLGKLTETIRQAIEKYEDSIQDREELKIIKYRFRLAGIKEDNEDGPNKYFGEGWNDRHSDLSISLEWEILTQVTAKTKIRKQTEEVVYLTLDDRSTSVDEEDRVVEWSQEAEDWFKGLEDQMRSMMIGIEGFMRLKEKEVQKLIDRGYNTHLLSSGVSK